MPDINAEYYGSRQPGRDDYWRKMAAPRFRVDTTLRLLEDAPWSSLVDLGCGDGALLSAVAARFPGARLGGVDLSARQIEINRQRQPNIDWRVADLGVPAAPSAGPVFDVAVASEIIEHLEDPRRFLENAAAWAPRGRLILSTQSGPMRETERRVGHRRHFSAEELRAVLEAAGWSPRRIWNCGFPFHDVSKWGANLFPNATMAQFSERPYGPFQNFVCAALRALFRFNSDTRGAQLFAVAERKTN